MPRFHSCNVKNVSVQPGQAMFQREKQKRTVTFRRRRKKPSQPLSPSAAWISLGSRDWQNKNSFCPICHYNFNQMFRKCVNLSISILVKKQKSWLSFSPSPKHGFREKDGIVSNCYAVY